MPDKKPATKRSAQPAAAVSYYEGVGRRKTAIARARIWAQKAQSAVVNEKPLEEYFDMPQLRKTALEAIEKLKLDKPFGVSVLIKGGGSRAQAVAVRHAISRALIKFDPELRMLLKQYGFLTRDPRTRERKKFGLKRARRARQWRKR